MPQYQKSGPAIENPTPVESGQADLNKLRAVVTAQADEIQDLKKQLRQLRSKVDSALAAISYISRGLK
jgi:HAMP domain-containing protein